MLFILLLGICILIVDGETQTSIILEDDDECALGTDNCHADATCSNTVDSFTCACNVGYSGDGTSCTGTSCLKFGVQVFSMM